MFSSNTSQVSNDAVFVEDVFSTWLYTGNGSTQTITNGIDLSGKGGMVWVKSRSDAYNGWVFDTQRGANKYIVTNLTSDQGNDPTLNWSFLSNGFSQNNNQNSVNLSGTTYASWTFRKQPKFFDVVTYTGDGVAGRTVAHNLGSTPGCIIVKATSAANDWLVYHTSLGNTKGMSISSTSAAATSTTYWNNTSPTSTQFTVGTSPRSNENGTTFVAYLFAHNAGGFGPTGTDNVISCGSFTADGSGNATVDLGYEPQLILYKKSSGTGNWQIYDNMRGWAQNTVATLYANLTAAEGVDNSSASFPTATGFSFVNSALLTASATYIYIAIRRGPMKTPTSGTSVFAPVARAGTSADATVSAGFPPDSLLVKNRGGSASSVDWSFNFFDKLRSPGYRLSTAFTNAEDTSVNFITSFDQNGVTLPATGYTATNGSGYNYINYFLRRAPGFFDEVCYTGDNVSGRTVQHNLGTAPDLVFVKCRSTAGLDWYAYGRTGNTNQLAGSLNNTWAFSSFAGFSGFTQQPTSQYLYLSSGADETNGSGKTYVAYLFGSVAGVSKVGTYTGTGATQTISCGFAARFVLIKRTDSTGDWFVWDTARGIVAGNDPYLLLNSTAAEVTNTDYVDAYAAGFEISSTAPAAINANGGTFIYLAIA